MANINLINLILFNFIVVGSSQRWITMMGTARRIHPFAPYELPQSHMRPNAFRDEMETTRMIPNLMVKPEEMSTIADEMQPMPVTPMDDGLSMNDPDTGVEIVPKVIPIVIKNIYYVFAIKSNHRKKEEPKKPIDTSNINTPPITVKPEEITPKPEEKPVSNVFTIISPQYDDDEDDEYKEGNDVKAITDDKEDNGDIEVKTINDDKEDKEDKVDIEAKTIKKDEEDKEYKEELDAMVRMRSKPIMPHLQSYRPQQSINKCFTAVANCGKRTDQLVGEKTLGGRIALNAEFPWHVSIQTKMRNDIYHLCSGVLILERWVVTTAACVQHRDINKLLAVLGSNNALELNENASELRFDRKIINDEYNDETLENNIAILRLTAKPAKSYPETEFINSICLCLPKVMPSKTLAVSGWGEKPDRLHTLDVNILHYTACESYGKYFNQEQMICAGDPRGRRDPSEGDEGGPLVLTENGRSYLFGIVSYNRGQEKTVYVKIAYYLRWIKHVVSKYCN